jgi:hypothetical protein
MGKNRAKDIMAEVAGLLASEATNGSGLHESYLGKDAGAYSEAIAALRAFGLIRMNREKMLSLTPAGRLVFCEGNGVTADDILKAYRGQRRDKSGRSNDIPGLPTLASLHRGIGTVSQRDTAALFGIRKNVQRLRGKVPRQDFQFGLTMYLAAIDREFDRRAHDMQYDEAFKWPDTEAPGGDGSVAGVQFMDEGMLLRMGYRVGVWNGEPEPVRRQILKQIFEDALPPLFRPDYMRKWGEKGTAQRLRTMACTIAPLTKNLKRQHDSRQDTAIAEYEADLQWLYETYYVGHFGFAWPLPYLD